MLDARTREVLSGIAEHVGTPAYVYFWPEIVRRIELLRTSFPDFAVSYAVKANPSPALLRRLAEDRELLVDVSSGGEIATAIRAGFEPERITFTGPAKRDDELRRAVDHRIGAVVVESPRELEVLDALGRAERRDVAVLLRWNPARVLRGFGVQMSGRPSQFGIDEEDATGVLDALAGFPHLRLDGFHVYAATSALDPTAVATGFATARELFARLAAARDLRPRRLVFGAGFGIPYTPDDEPLDLGAVRDALEGELGALRGDARLGGAATALELGRWIVGPAGWFLTRVVAEKRSRGVEVRLCDGGFHTHLAACGLMGTVVRRNWPIHRLSSRDDGPDVEHMLTGPLCTSIDVLASRIRLPPVRRGDVLAIASSGAYGASASPTRFIGHLPPREVLVLDDDGREWVEAGPETS